MTTSLLITDRILGFCAELSKTRLFLHLTIINVVIILVSCFLLLDSLW